MKKLTDIRPQAANANRHTERGMKALERSIQEDGWIGAITVAADGETFDGSARLEVGTGAGFDDAIVIESDGSRPVILRRTDIPSADDPRAKRLGIAANRVAELNLEWEPGVLAGLAEEAEAYFTTEEWAEVAQPSQPEPGLGGDEFDATPQDGPTRTQLGDLWQIGPHRLLVGDCTDAGNVARLMGGEKPFIMVTDPPYGVEYDPNWRVEAAEAGHLAYAPSRIGKVANDERVDWSDAWKLAEADVFYCWHAGRRASSVQASIEAAGFEIRSQIIWAKTNYPISRGHYHWRHEPCWYAVRKDTTARWAGDRKQTTVWNDINLDKNVGMEEGGHGTQKPLECMARPIRNHGAEGDIVYDPFLGSGTTLIAAHRTGRRCYGLELEPRYADVILRRAEAEGLTCEKDPHAL